MKKESYKSGIDLQKGILNAGSSKKGWGSTWGVGHLGRGLLWDFKTRGLKI